MDRGLSRVPDLDFIEHQHDYDMSNSFDPDCKRCPRLAAHLKKLHIRSPEYHNRPVAPFGAASPELLIVGLAPGMHGANRTGRPFTGDFAGILLYQTLYEFGFSSSARALSHDDGLQLNRCRITNAVKCLPPGNRPTIEEIRYCNGYLKSEIGELASGSVILALGTVAHQAVLRATGLAVTSKRFSHGAIHELPGDIVLVDSYHCSRYMTQTKRLTPDMFKSIFNSLSQLLGDRGPLHKPAVP